jgi:hypothetical protein
MYPLLALIIGAALTGPQMCEIAPDGIMFCANGGRMEVGVERIEGVRLVMSCICLGEIDPSLSLQDQSEIARVHEGIQKEIRERAKLEAIRDREKASLEREGLREMLHREMKARSEADENAKFCKDRMEQLVLHERGVALYKSERCDAAIEHEREQARFVMVFAAIALLQILYYFCLFVWRVISNDKFRTFCEDLLLAAYVIMMANGPYIQSLFVK